MRIASKPGIDRQRIGAEQAAMDAKRAYVAKEMKTLREQRKAAGAKAGQGRVGGWHRDAVYAAVAKYGPEVMTAAGQEFWDDQKRAYPEACADDRIPGVDSPNGHKTRGLKIREKYMHGKWYHWDAVLGGWAEGEVTKRKGVK